MIDAVDDDDRTTAQGLFVFADSYLASAKSLRAAALRYGHAESPIRFLLYHAAELYLKAFLRASGLSMADVKSLGHEFRKLLRAAKRKGLIVADDARAPLLFGERTKDVIETRYIRTGFRRGRSTLEALALSVSLIRRAVREHEARQGQIVLPGERAGEVGEELEEPWA